MKKILIYGSYGYTGTMITEHLVQMEQDVVIAGRNGMKLVEMGKNLNLPFIAFALDTAQNIDVVLKDFDIVLNCAGPFHRTAQPLMEAALRNNVHYLDVSAELESYALAQKLSKEAEAKGVLLMPGCGGSVTMIGCLTAFAKKLIPNPEKAQVALHVTGSMSRGSAVSASENVSTALIARRAHELENLEDISSVRFNFGNGFVDCTPVTLPDVITLWNEYNIPDITTYVHISGAAFPTGDLALLPDGPSKQEREANRYQAAVHLKDKSGNEVRAVLNTVNGYAFTPMAAALAVRQVSDDKFSAGFQTSFGLWGSDFVRSIPSTTMEVLS